MKADLKFKRDHLGKLMKTEFTWCDIQLLLSTAWDYGFLRFTFLSEWILSRQNSLTGNLARQNTARPSPEVLTLIDNRKGSIYKDSVHQDQKCGIISLLKRLIPAVVSLPMNLKEKKLDYANMSYLFWLLQLTISSVVQWQSERLLNLKSRVCLPGQTKCL